VNYVLEWIPAGVVLGTVLLLLIVPEFALIALLVVASVAFAALIVLAAAIVSIPYLLVRTLRRRRAERRRRVKRSARIGTALQRPTTAIRREGLATLAEPTSARKTR
jgi:membrane protein implicated in regulation of membrane protease activity